MLDDARCRSLDASRADLGKNALDAARWALDRSRCLYKKSSFFSKKHSQSRFLKKAHFGEYLLKGKIKSVVHEKMQNSKFATRRRKFRLAKTDGEDDVSRSMKKNITNCSNSTRGPPYK